MHLIVVSVQPKLKFFPFFIALFVHENNEFYFINSTVQQIFKIKKIHIYEKYSSSSCFVINNNIL